MEGFFARTQYPGLPGPTRLLLSPLKLGFAFATIMDSRRRQNNCVIAFCGDRAFVSRAPTGRDNSAAIHHLIT